MAKRTQQYIEIQLELEDKIVLLDSFLWKWLAGNIALKVTVNLLTYRTVVLLTVCSGVKQQHCLKESLNREFHVVRLLTHLEFQLLGTTFMIQSYVKIPHIKSLSHMNCPFFSSIWVFFIFQSCDTDFMSDKHWNFPCLVFDIISVGVYTDVCIQKNSYILSYFHITLR